MSYKILMWFRQDLRLYDNPALYEASQHERVLPIYILDDLTPTSFKMGAASKWWLYHSLLKLNTQLDNKLNVYQGSSKDVILSIIENNQLDTVYWNRCYEPWRIKVDSEIKSILKEKGIKCQSFNASLLWEPMEVKKRDGTPYKVFTPFYHKGCLQAIPPRKP